MKLLFDENLSPRLTELLRDVYPQSVHVHSCGLGSADDGTIWRYAKENDFTIVSKDSDFLDRSVVLGFPPKVVWIQAANCTTSAIEQTLRDAGSALSRFIENKEESCLMLWPRLG